MATDINRRKLLLKLKFMMATYEVKQSILELTLDTDIDELRDVIRDTIGKQNITLAISNNVQFIFDGEEVDWYELFGKVQYKPEDW